MDQGDDGRREGGTRAHPGPAHVVRGGRRDVLDDVGTRRFGTRPLARGRSTSCPASTSTSSVTRIEVPSSHPNSPIGSFPARTASSNPSSSPEVASRAPGGGRPTVRAWRSKRTRSRPSPPARRRASRPRSAATAGSSACAARSPDAVALSRAIANDLASTSAHPAAAGCENGCRDDSRVAHRGHVPAHPVADLRSHRRAAGGPAECQPVDRARDRAEHRRHRRSGDRLRRRTPLRHDELDRAARGRRLDLPLLGAEAHPRHREPGSDHGDARARHRRALARLRVRAHHRDGDRRDHRHHREHRDRPARADRPGPRRRSTRSATRPPRHSIVWPRR